MQAIPSRVEFAGWGAWAYHHIWIAGVVIVAFFLGAAWNNHDATKEAVTSVQGQYQGKVEYHIQHEKAVVSAATKALDACQRNLSAALNNDAPVQDLKGCPPVPKK
jgi:hypothetical protein